MNSLAHVLHELVLVLDRQAADLLRPLDLTYRRYVALVVVDEHPGLRGRDLAGALGVTEAATSGIVNTLLDAGLLKDVSAPGSGRARRLELTSAGRRLLQRATTALGGSFDDVVRDTGHDPDELASILTTITHRLTDPKETTR